MDAFGVVILQIIAMVAVGYTMASITIAVLSTLNEANAESLVRDVAILISCMVGLDKSLCFGERNLFPVCNKSSRDIYQFISNWNTYVPYMNIRESLTSSTSGPRSLLIARFVHLHGST